MSTPKKVQHEAALSDAVTGAPVAISPGKAVELCMKNFEQLHYLQQLYEDGILTTKEFEEQKEKILSSLRKLN